MNFNRLFTAVVLLLVTSSAAIAQNILTGRVTSSDDGSPLVGAAVLVRGSDRSAITDLDGRYSIKASKGETLFFSCLGMQDKEVLVGDETVLDVVMKLDSKLLDEVMVVAYGTTKKESFTGSAEVVKSDKLKDRASTNITKMLDGQVSGVMTTSGSGQPGSGSSIRIRGFGSINASSSPLLVVDGVPFDGELNSINANDIESISVLKDASAGALYGARGANGVLLITTSRAASNDDRMVVRLSAKTGVSTRAIPAYDTMDAKEYMEHMYQAFYNDLVYSEGYLPQIARTMTVDRLASRILGEDSKYNIYNVPISELFDEDGKVISSAAKKYNENWIDEASRKAAFRQEYNLSVNGSGDKSRYNMSLSYLDEDGTLRTTGFKRYSERAGLELTPKEWLELGANTSISFTDSRYLGASGTEGNNVWYSAMMMAPIYPVYEKNPDGSDVLSDGSKVFDYGVSRPAGAQNNRNSVATLFEDDYYSQSYNVSARTYASLKWKGFKLSTNFGTDMESTYQSTKYNRNSGNAAGTGRLTKENGRMMSYTWNQLLTFNQDFGEKQKLDILAGHEFYRYSMRYNLGSRTGFPFDEFDDLGMGSTLSDANSVSDYYSINSWLSRVNYSFADRYYLSASFRMDASSRFEKNHRWGSFWSLGASWRISEEAFLKEASWIDNMTLKASYGVQGNDNLGSYYAWQSLYDMNYPNANNSGAIIASVESRDITWEKNGNMNLGIEFRLFNRMTGSIEAYSRRTDDLLLESPMAISLGFPGFYDNVGSLVNRGLDMTLGYDLISRPEFRWNLTLIGSTLKNKVLKLTDNGADIVSGIFLIREGEPVNTFYLAKSAGVDPTTGQQLYYAYEKDADGKMIDGSEYITNDQTLASGCKYLMGSRIPALYGSVSSSLNYKGFDLSLLFTYSFGGRVYDSIYDSLMEPSFVGQTYHKNALRSWSGPGDRTDVPKAMTGLSSLSSDRFLVDASYFAVKNITVGYSFPSGLMKKCGLESLRVFAACDSPLLFTHLKGMDPQASFSGTTSYQYTPNRTLNLGIDLTF